MKSSLKLKSFLYLSIFSLISIFNTQIKSQAFGFGCLGLSGFYAGYTVQDYNPTGFNSYLNSISNNTQKFAKTSRTEGIRVGANIFRANISSYFITLKGFYQFMKETKTIDALTANFNGNQEFELKTDYWGFGLDFGFTVFNFLDLKLVEGGVAFYNVKLKNSYTPVGGDLVENLYSEPKSTVGYYVGSGLILHLIKNYISIEGTAIYNFMDIKSLQRDSGFGPRFISNNGQKLITKGGLGISVQLNLGFPL